MRYFFLIFTVCVVAVISIAGFRGRISRKPPLYIFPDMKRQLKLRPMTPDAFFANGVSSQLPPVGTVPQSEPMKVGVHEVYPYEDAPANTGRITGTTNYVETNPFPVTEQLLARGRQRFTIYCTPCHGQLADGNGITKKIGAMAVVANLHDKRIVELPDGQIFDTITHGKGVMQPYGPQIPVQDRWAIVAYVRVLQLSQLGSVDELTPEERARLK